MLAKISLSFWLLFSVTFLFSCSKEDDPIVVEIVSIYPEHQAIVPSSLRYIQITLDQEISSPVYFFTQPIELLNEQGKVVSTVTNLVGNSLFILILDQLLPASEYSLQINELYNDFQIKNAPEGHSFFTSQEVDQESPTLLASFPTHLEQDVSRRAEITLTFSKPIFLQDQEEVLLVNRDTFEAVEFSVRVEQDTLVITPQRALDLMSFYTLYIDDAISDLSGNMFKGVSIDFKTGKDSLHFVERIFDVDISGYILPYYFLENESGKQVKVFATVTGSGSNISTEVFAQIKSADSSQFSAPISVLQISSLVRELKAHIDDNGGVTIATRSASPSLSEAGIHTATYYGGVWRTRNPRQAVETGRVFGNLKLTQDPHGFTYVFWTERRSGDGTDINYVVSREGVQQGGVRALAFETSENILSNLSSHYSYDNDELRFFFTRQTSNQFVTLRMVRLSGGNILDTSNIITTLNQRHHRFQGGNGDYYHYWRHISTDGSDSYFIYTLFDGPDAIISLELDAEVGTGAGSGVVTGQTENDKVILVSVGGSSREVTLTFVDPHEMTVQSFKLPNGFNANSIGNIKIFVQGNDFLVSYTYLRQLVTVHGSTESMNFQIKKWPSSEELGLEEGRALYIENAWMTKESSLSDRFWNLTVLESSWDTFSRPVNNASLWHLKL